MRNRLQRPRVLSHMTTARDVLLELGATAIALALPFTAVLAIAGAAGFKSRSS